MPINKTDSTINQTLITEAGDPQKTGVSTPVKSFSSVSALPPASQFGKGVAQVGHILYVSDGVSWSDGEEVNQTINRKVLICYDISDASTAQVIGAANADGQLQIMRSQLERMGYSYEIMFATNTSQFFADFAKAAQGFEFIVFLNVAFSWSTSNIAHVFLTGAAKIPVFALGQYAQSTTTAGVIGLNRITTRDYRWCTHVPSGAKLPLYTSEMDALNSTVAASIVPLVTIDQPVGAPVYLSKLIAAGKRIGTNNNVYFDCAGLPNRSTLFPLLLQEAINDGKLQKPDYPLTGAFDVDDMPEENPFSLADCENLYALQTRYNIPITWGMKTAVSQIANINGSLWGFVAQRTPDKGGLIYAIEHDGDDYWSESLESTIETEFLTAIDRAKAVGLTLGWDGYDSWGYRFFNTNAINQSGLNVCKKYGINVARFNRGIKAPRNHTDKWIRPIGRGNSITEYNGVLCIESATYIDLTERNVSILQEPGRADAGYGLLRYAYTFSMWNDFCLAKGAPLYFHGDNFYYNGNNGGNAPGHLIFEAIAKCCEYASDVMKIVHPSAFRTELHSKFSYLSE